MQKDVSVDLTDLVLVWPLPETAMGILCNCLEGALPYAHYVIQSFLLFGAKALHPAQMIQLDSQPC